MIATIEHSHDYLQRLKFLNLESLELRRIYNDLIMVYKIVHGLVNINANELIHIKTSTSTISTRGHLLNFKPLNLNLTLQRINSAIESYATGTPCLILLLPLTPLFTSRKHFALYISKRH